MKDLSHLRAWHLKLKLRKWTTPFHILSGLVIVAAILYPPVLAVLLFIGLAFFEYWNWQVENDSGCADWWEIILGMYIGASVIIILKIVGVI